MLKIKAKNAGRSEICEICACHREVEGAGHVVYCVVRESGKSRAAYGTSCEFFYTLLIKSESGLCRLTDVSREQEAALSLCSRFAAAGVLPMNAEEVYEDLCLA